MGPSAVPQGQDLGRASHQAGVLALLEPLKLNPAERIFEEVRRHVEGKVYEDLEAKRHEVESYLKELQAAPERVRSLCGWGWLREALESLSRHEGSP